MSPSEFVLLEVVLILVGAEQLQAETINKTLTLISRAKISVESVIARNPDAIVASGMAEQRPYRLDGAAMLCELLDRSRAPPR